MSISGYLHIVMLRHTPLWLLAPHIRVTGCVSFCHNSLLKAIYSTCHVRITIFSWVADPLALSKLHPHNPHPLVRYWKCFSIGKCCLVCSACLLSRIRRCPLFGSITSTGIAVGTSTVVRYTEEVRYWEGLLSEVPLYAISKVHHK